MRNKFLLLMLIVITTSVGCAGMNKQPQVQPPAEIPNIMPQTIIIADTASLPSDHLQKWYEINKNVEGLHTTTEKDTRYFLIGAGIKPTSGYRFGDPSFAVTPTSIKVSITLHAPEKGSVTTQTINYPHILFSIINDQRPVIYDGYDLSTMTSSASQPALYFLPGINKCVVAQSGSSSVETIGTLPATIIHDRLYIPLSFFRTYYPAIEVADEDMMFSYYEPLIPMRRFFELAGCYVQWDGKSAQVNASDDLDIYGLIEDSLDEDLKYWLSESKAMSSPGYIHFVDPTFGRLLKSHFKGVSGGITPSDLDKITSISIMGKEITINGSPGFAEPTHLWGSITRIDDLAMFKNLTSISISYNPIVDISPLRGLPLTHVQFVSNFIADISPLKGLPLTHIYFVSNYIESIDPLENMLTLTHLGIVGNRLTQIDKVLSLKNLEMLDISGNSIKKVAFLSQMESLKSLSLHGNPIEDLMSLIFYRPVYIYY